MRETTSRRGRGERRAAPAPPAATAELRERICGLICVPVRDHRGHGADMVLEERAEYPWGGYIVFGGELGPVRELLHRLRAAVPHPLLLASDLERGLGQQLSAGTSFPPPMAVGAAGDPGLAWELGRATAREAAAVGFNCVFAPVLDLANEPQNPIVCTRSFGDDPAAVAELGAATIRGLHAGGVLATAKHFPGHGRTSVDSHSVLPVVDADAEALLASDLLPFRAAVEAGVALVMSAHVAYPGLERAAEGIGEARPATLSGEILGGLLRERLGFGGAVVSDALMMGALSGEDPAELAARALRAGIDCLLYPPDPRQVAEGLVQRVLDGRLEMDVVERAWRNLAAALERPWIDAQTGRSASAPARAREPAPAAEPDALGGAPPLGPNAELALRAARAGLVGVGESGHAGRARGRAGGAAASLVLLLLDGGIERSQVVLPAVARRAGREFHWLVPGEGDTALPPELHRFDEVYLAWFSPVRAWKGRTGLSPEAASLARELLAARPDSVLISFSSPFILTALPGLRAAVLAFGEAPVCQIAVGEVLDGRVRPAGRLPIRLDLDLGAPE